MNKEWNATVYHQVSAPQVSWGKKVLSRVKLWGDERVLDAGCGTGRLTRDLLEALPRGQVVALDVSRNMIDAARAHLEPEYGSRVEFVCCDLLELPFEAEFDVVFSTASLHWVTDHDQLFQNLYRALRPAGWLIAQCGGGRNLERLLSRVAALAKRPPYERYLATLPRLWEYSDAETASSRLSRAGFAQVETSLEEAPTKFETADEYQLFVQSVILHRHLERLPDRELRETFLAELTSQAAKEDPPFLLDYWRLNLQARRPT